MHGAGVGVPAEYAGPYLCLILWVKYHLRAQPPSYHQDHTNLAVVLALN